MLDEIREALEGVDERVYYGTGAAHPKNEPWNYTVFGRRKTKVNQGLTSKGAEFDVAVVREGYVPEGTEDEVIEAMRSIPGVAPVSGQSIQYLYDTKPGTSLTVEMMVITFAKSEKTPRRA